MRSVLLLTLLSALPLAAGPLVVLTYEQEFTVTYEGEFHEISFSPGWPIRPHWKYVDGYAYAGGSLTRYGTIYNPWPEPTSTTAVERSFFRFDFVGVSDYSGHGGEFLAGPLDPGESVPFTGSYPHVTSLDLTRAIWSAHPSGKLSLYSTLYSGPVLDATLDHTDANFSVYVVAVFEAPEPSYGPVMLPGLAAMLFLAGHRKRRV